MPLAEVDPNGKAGSATTTEVGSTALKWVGRLRGLWVDAVGGTCDVHASCLNAE